MMEREDVGGEVDAESATEAANIGRREFLKTAAMVGAGLGFAPPLLTDGSVSAQSPPAHTIGGNVAVRLRVNGANYGLRLDPRTSLLDLLREQLDLTGTKKGCNHGQCGACTVLVDGRRINACLALAVTYDGSDVRTIEGLSTGDDLHPVQAAFIRHEGFQCGYCTSGQVCSVVGMLQEVEQGTASHVTADVRRHDPIELTDEEIRERMSGNICRCGAYPGIVDAVQDVNRRSRMGA